MKGGKLIKGLAETRKSGLRSITQVVMLLVLAGDGPQRITHLAAMSGVSVTNINAMVDHLVSLGLVTRDSSHRVDGVVVSATERGIQTVKPLLTP